MHDIGSLVFLALFFALVFEFFRGIDALRKIASSLERIERVLAKAPPPVPNEAASHTAS